MRVANAILVIINNEKSTICFKQSVVGHEVLLNSCRFFGNLCTSRLMICGFCTQIFVLRCFWCFPLYDFPILDILSLLCRDLSSYQHRFVFLTCNFRYFRCLGLFLKFMFLVNRHVQLLAQRTVSGDDQTTIF